MIPRGGCSQGPRPKAQGLRSLPPWKDGWTGGGGGRGEAALKAAMESWHVTEQTDSGGLTPSTHKPPPDPNAFVTLSYHLQGNLVISGTASWSSLTSPHHSQMPHASPGHCTYPPAHAWDVPSHYPVSKRSANAGYFSSTGTSVGYIPRHVSHVASHSARPVKETCLPYHATCSRVRTPCACPLGQTCQSDSLL